jgi:hypothetical protein
VFIIRQRPPWSGAHRLITPARSLAGPAASRVDRSVAPQVAPARRAIGGRRTISSTKEQTHALGKAWRRTEGAGSGVRC